MKKILFATSECVPFIKTGGLADVAGALPKALIENGYEGKTVVLGIRPEDIHDEQIFLSQSPDTIVDADEEVAKFKAAVEKTSKDLETIKSVAAKNLSDDEA